MPLTKKNFQKQEEPVTTTPPAEPIEPVVSKSQEKREAVMKEASKLKTVKVRMRVDYRDEVKAGEVYETDPEKAAELVRIKRAEYIK